MRSYIDLHRTDPDADRFISSLPISRAWTVPAGSTLHGGAFGDLAARCGLADDAFAPSDIASLNDALDNANAPFEHLIATAGQPRMLLLVRAAPLRSGTARAVIAVEDKTTEQRLRTALARSEQSLIASNLGRSLEPGDALHLALNDPLTGLPNRRAFNIALEDALEDGAFMLCMFDMDNFKDINDRLGHAVGDELLAAVAQRLRAHLPGEPFVARLAGDEFAAILRGINHEAAAQVVADRIASAFRTRLTLSDVEVGISLSVGSALAAPGLSSEELYRRADIALHTAKLDTKGTARLHRGGSGPLADHDVLGQIRTMLHDRTAPLAADAVSTSNGERFGLAVRLAPGGEGAPHTSAFFETAQRFGVASDLLNLVARNACGLLASHGEAATVHLALPSSALNHPSAARDILEPFTEMGLPATSLAIETPAIPTGSPASDALDTLTRAGVDRVLAPWDLGVSGFDELSNGAIATVKIPFAHVAPLLCSASGSRWVQCALAALPEGVIACASGVSDASRAAAARRAGFRALQGPLPATGHRHRLATDTPLLRAAG